MAWTNHDMVLFHGTSRENAEAILEKGVLLSECRPRRDFGLGFYTTTSSSQAANWARSKWDAADDPTLVVFEVPRDGLGLLESLWFVRATPDADDFWQFVEYCRTGGALHGRPQWYDLVIGPVTKAGYRESYQGYDQISFHSERAITLLNAAPRNRIGI